MKKTQVLFVSKKDIVELSELDKISPNSKILREYKKSLTGLNEFQWKASIGLMLGDASLQTQDKGKTHRMKFEWGNKNLPYLNSVHKLFNEWVISKPHEKTRISPKGNNVTNWGFQTISHEAFNPLATLFLKSKKVILKDLIKNHLTAVGLAYWFMDDGGKLDYNPNSKNKGLVLNTQSFTNEEVKEMSEQLNEKFNLNTELRANKGKKVIVIKNYDGFISLVDPYLVPEMRYKLPK